jgi:hypothetical protein
MHVLPAHSFIEFKGMSAQLQRLCDERRVSAVHINHIPQSHQRFGEEFETLVNVS